MIISRRVSRPATVAVCLGLAILVPTAVMAAPGSQGYNNGNRGLNRALGVGAAVAVIGLILEGQLGNGPDKDAGKSGQ